MTLLRIQSVSQFICSVVSDSLWPHESQHARPPCPSPTPGVHSDSCPSSQWCHLAISSFVVPFSSYPQSLPASESFPISQLFTWGGQSTGVSALASFLPKKSQGWSPSEWTGWISLQSKGLSSIFSNLPCSYLQIFICRNVSLSSTRKKKTLNNSYQWRKHQLRSAIQSLLNNPVYHEFPGPFYISCLPCPKAPKFLFLCRFLNSSSTYPFLLLITDCSHVYMCNAHVNTFLVFLTLKGRDFLSPTYLPFLSAEKS